MAINEQKDMNTQRTDNLGSENRMCTLTILDESIPDICFDKDGVCNFARRAQWRLKNEVFHGQDREERLASWISRIQSDGRGSEYDCIIGLSGGVDSSYVALKVAELGLRPLAIHLDNGWNSDLAVRNIEQIVKTLKIDLYTHVIDWEEMRDLQRAYIQASLLDLECVSDHAINTVLFRLAKKHRIKHVIHGGNVATESIMPSAWGYDKRDGVNVRSVHRKHGKVPLRSYPSMLPSELFYYLFVGRISAFAILNYLNYSKTAAIEELRNGVGWQPYARKHGENRFTRFFQELYLPKKFGIDKRKAHLSSLILAGEVTRDEALQSISKPLYTEEEYTEEVAFVGKKLGFTPDQLLQLMQTPGCPHNNYANVEWMFDHSRGYVQLARYLAKGEFSVPKLRAIWNAGGSQA